MPDTPNKNDETAKKIGRIAGRSVRVASAMAAREFNKRTAPAAPARQAARPAPAPVPVAPPHVPGRGERFIHFVVFWGWIAALVCFGLFCLNFATFFGEGTTRLLDLITGGVLVVEAVVLMSDWYGARKSLVARVTRRTWGNRPPETRRERAFAALIRDAINVIALAFFAVAVYAVLRGTVGLG